jgi:hypothetical protein
MGIAATMDEIGTKLKLIYGLNVKAWNALSVTAPAAVIQLPTEIDYQIDYGRGGFSAKTKIHILVGKLSDQNSRDVLDKYLDTSGDHSVYRRVDSGNDNKYATCDAVTVESAEVITFEVAGVDYLDAVFSIEFARHGGAR